MTDELDLVRRLRPDVDAPPEILARERTRLMAVIESRELPVSSPPPGTPQIIPTLPYQDGLAAIEWLERAFGFQEIEHLRIEAPGGVHAHLELGSGRIMIGSPGGHGAFPPKGAGSPSLMLSVYVDDVDAHYARAREAGAHICAEIEDKFYGDRVYEALDLEGHRWSFHQHTGRTFPMNGRAPEDDGG